MTFTEALVQAEATSLTTRHAEPGDLAALLRDQQAATSISLCHGSALRARVGMLVIARAEPVLTNTGAAIRISISVAKHAPDMPGAPVGADIRSTRPHPVPPGRIMAVADVLRDG